MRRERGRDERAAQRVTARPRRVERDEVDSVTVERRPGQRVPEHELDRDGDRPRRRPARRRLDPPALPELPGRQENEQKRDDDLARQRHDLGRADAEWMKRRVQKRDEPFERGRCRGRRARKRHRVIDSPLVEAGRSACADEGGQRDECRGSACGDATQPAPAGAGPPGRPRSAPASLRSARRRPRAAAARRR